MASVSLQSRLTLNCKLSGRTKSGSALTVGIVQALRSRKAAPSGGSSKLRSDLLRGIRQCVGEREHFRVAELLSLRRSFIKEAKLL